MGGWKLDLSKFKRKDQAPAVEDDLQRIAERRAAVEKNALLDYASADADAEARFLSNRTNDPYPHIPPALLNSADIAAYVAATGMVIPFDPSRLKTASYEVALLGTWFYIDEKGEYVTGELNRGDKFTLRKNSIAFMSTEPYLRLPDYIALRHNLKISHVYKGLLVGTGPLIDPGFVGKIGLPLHNLTETDYELVGGEGIIWVEFTKLSPHPTWAPQTALHPARYVNFPAEATRGRTLQGYVKQAVGRHGVPSSSSASIANVAKKANRKSGRAMGITTATTLASVIALITVGITVLIAMSSFSDRLANLQEQVTVISTPTPTAPSTTPSPLPSATP